MKAFAALLALLVVPAAAHAQSFFGTNAPAGSTTVVTATGSTAPRALSDRAAERINVKDYGAKGDTKSDAQSTVSITSGTTALVVSGSDFSAADVGKRIIVDGAGVQATAGQLTSIPVTAAGSGYVTVPTVSLANTGGGSAAQASANMKLISATVATGGAGCTTGAQTFTVMGGTLGTAATFTGTVAAGAVSGALTVTAPGSYLSGTATKTLIASAATVTGGGCTTAPTINASWGVASILIGAYGINYPSAGVTASLSGGTATLGTPVVTLPIAPLSTTIAGYVSPTAVTLAATASTTLSAVNQTITWGHDDSAAFQAAMTAANTAWSNSVQSIIYMPASNYLISSTLPTSFHNGVSWVGDGRNRTTIKLDSIYSGPLFSWSEGWMGGGVGGGTYPQLGPTIDISKSFTGPQAIGFSIVGDTTSPNEQDAFVFYDRNDDVLIRDVTVSYMTGRGVWVGALLNTPQAYMRESRFDELYLQHVGGVSLPNIEINSVGSGDSSNEITLVNTNMWDIGGPGVVLRNANTVKTTNDIKFFGLRIEGGNIGAIGDGLQIGDPTLTGAVSNVAIYGLEVIALGPGSNGISILSQNAIYNPYLIRIEGQIQSVGGLGLNVLAGRNIQFVMGGIGSNDTNVTVGGNVGSPIRLDANGAEALLTYNNTSTNSLFTPLLGVGAPNTSAITATIHDGTIAGGSTALGANAVDLQMTRSSASQVASGIGSAMVGGTANFIAPGAQYTFVGAGALNQATGQFNMVAGKSVDTSQQYGVNCYSGGGIATPGDSQTCYTTLVGKTNSTSAVRLTGDNAAANVLNCAGLTTAGILTMDIHLAAFDTTTQTNSYSWIEPQGLLNRGATVGSTTYSHGTPTVVSTGTVTGLAISETADTTNGCLNLTFTPPTGNTDTWNAVATVKYTRSRP